MPKSSYPFSSTRLDVCEQRARYAYDNISWTRAIHERQALSAERRRRALGVFVLLCLVGAFVCALFVCFWDLEIIQFVALGLVAAGIFFEVILRVRDYGHKAAEEETASTRFLTLQRSAMNVLSTVRFGGLDPHDASALVDTLENDYQNAVDAAPPVSEAAMRRTQRSVSHGLSTPALEAGEAYLPDYLKISSTEPSEAAALAQENPKTADTSTQLPAIEVSQARASNGQNESVAPSNEPSCEVGAQPIG